MSSSEPWITLRRTYEVCLEMLEDVERERYAAFREGAFAGFLVLNMKGAFAGYLQTICVTPECRAQGVGSRMIRFAEERIFAQRPNVFLCVSAFNPGARRLYERLGYSAIGELTDYIVAGQSEILMRKTRGPLLDYRP
jgi:ribosomal protein S18 acetylase RimI-like enzyme